MARKVIQFKAHSGWNRVATDDINALIRQTFPSWPNGHIKKAVRYLIANALDLGIHIRFDRMSKCREESYKGFTSTEEYLRTVESEALFI